MRQKLLFTFLLAVSIIFFGNTGCEPDPVDQFTDERDGQTYKTIQIGDQIWMAENLKYLPSVSPSSKGSREAPYYYVYDYEGTSISEAKATDNFNTYGVLYNWPAALTACPQDWKLPSDAEWTTLTNFLGDNAGGKMKSTTLWISPNTDATNESGWSGLPGGYCVRDGGFYVLGSSGYWWSSTEFYPFNAWYRYLYYGHGYVLRDLFNKDYAFSVRCLRD